MAVLVVRSGSSGFREPESREELAARIGDAVGDALDDAHVPGAAVAVVHAGAPAWAHGYGERVTPRTRFQVGSLSKPVAAWALVRRGEPGLDAPLETTVRPWPLPGARGVTLRRLLSHTAGLSVDGYLGLDPDVRVPTTLASLRGEGPAGRATAVEQVDPPGTRWRYSGGGYTVAQYAIERATGVPFARWARREALAPLGMRESGFGEPPTTAGHDASGHPVPTYRYAELAAAGLVSTADDMGRFAAALLDDDELGRPQPATDGHWGLGLETGRLDDGTRVLSHEGVNRGWHARLLVYPERGWAAVVLTNGDGGEAVADAVQGQFER